jgi:hypothetical protein
MPATERHPRCHEREGPPPRPLGAGHRARQAGQHQRQQAPGPTWGLDGDAMTADPDDHYAGHTTRTYIKPEARA